MTVGLFIELLVNFIQQFVFVGFLYLFFDKTDNKIVNISSFAVSVLLLFSMESYFTLNEMTFNHLDSIIIVVVLLVYSVVFLRGALYLRIIIPFVTFGLNIIVAFGLLFLTSFLGGKTMEEAVMFSTAFRYMYLVIVNLTYVFLLWLILRISKRKIYLNNIYDMVAYIAVPALCMIAMYTDVIIYEKTDFNDSIFFLIIINLIIMFIASFMIWFLLIKTSKNNKIKTELLLQEQREEMYKKSVLSTNEQIESISKIKHDIKNKTSSIYQLLESNEIDIAKKLCLSVDGELKETFTPLATKNPVLNAIVNVEIKKAIASGINFSQNISENLLLVDDSDVISLVGNLCDNAIEYLICIPKEKRYMELNIHSHNNFYCITCINTIKQSVLRENPNLDTTKADCKFHGKGLDILKNISNKYNGELVINEEDKKISISIILNILSDK